MVLEFQLIESDKYVGYNYDLSTFELCKNYVHHLTMAVDLISYIFLSKTYIKSLRYNLYIRQVKHYNFSKTVDEYEVIWNGNYYKIQRDFFDNLYINDTVVGNYSGALFLAVENKDVVLRVSEYSISLSPYKGVCTPIPDGYITLDNDRIIEEINLEAKDTVCVRGNTLFIDNRPIQLRDAYLYGYQEDRLGVIFDAESVEFEDIKIVNYLFGDLDILYILFVPYLEDIEVSFKVLNNGSVIFPYKDDEGTKGFYLSHKGIVYKVELQNFVECSIESKDSISLFQVSGGRLVMVIFGAVFIFEDGYIYEYCNPQNKIRCTSDISETVLKRRYLFGE